MSITVHIERLILDGLPAKRSQGPLVQTAVEAELTHLLGEEGLSASFTGAVPRVAAGSIQLIKGSQPAHLGHQIAQAVHRGLTLMPSGSSRPRAGR